MGRRAASLVLASSVALAVAARAPALQRSPDAADPVSYILARASTHRAVLIGEAHWIRHDAELLQSLAERAAAAGVQVLAIEWLPASEQARITSVTTARDWNRAEAIAILRAAAWPYEEYLEVLRRAWLANSRAQAGSRVRVVGLSPPANWRETLPKGSNYETFMADRVVEAITTPRQRAIVWLGVHHMFARFALPDLPERPGQPITRVSDRTGNQLWRELGDSLFTILLHYPWTCAAGDRWGRCLPVEAAIDCAAVRDGKPIGFDLATSPLGDALISRQYWFGLSTPRARLLDLADGYVWSRPIEDYASVSLIPLTDFAPDASALAEVLAHNPVSDDAIRTRTELETAWRRRAEAMARIHDDRGWTSLSGWRAACGARTGRSHPIPN